MLLPLSLLAFFATLTTAVAVRPNARKAHRDPNVAARGLLDGVLGDLGLGSSQSTIDAYLAAHNSIRAGHGAVDLSWNKTLADAASSWASSCQLKHSDGTLLDGPYGENIVAATGHFPIANAMQQFVLDEAEYDPSTPTYNHFTQVVWKHTTQLGCAVSQCSGIFPNSDGPASYYVCLYDPPGNVIGGVAANVQA
ncbi:CAP domain-containing protein [Mycena alexandri]|uniref:CAP domain-containing protein n=1 Tax=Mycena alexandri TaxID=1745969 RepID=A0AAD6TDU6_9AGAR|nr:CAP domain-containing protein [Mycena alexandri]